MQQHIGHIKAIIQQFQREEAGNRLSIFALAALQSMIDSELAAMLKKWEEETKKHTECAETELPKADEPPNEEQKIGESPVTDRS